MSYLDNLNNPLWDSLLQGGAKTAEEILAFVNGAVTQAENLFRLDENGIAHKTGHLVLYSGQFVSDGVKVQAGNIAQDLSLRSPDITALDTTRLGMLAKDLERIQCSPVGS
jgi:hypothetical protein